jgi:D-tyrosyl-tRNA(Tyr) deacylase
MTLPKRPDDAQAEEHGPALASRTGFPHFQWMRAVIQRVSQASVTVEGQVTGRIAAGLLVLVAVEDADTAEDVEWLAGKIVRLRVFKDPAGVMNLSVQDVAGEVLVISQFTLYASTRKGNRPSYLRAAKPEVADPAIEHFKSLIAKALNRPVPSGIFGAHMAVNLTNDGPVTIVIDSRNPE